MHGSKCEKQLVILKLPHINSLYKAVRQRANVYKEIHISKRVYHLIILLKDYYIIIFSPFSVLSLTFVMFLVFICNVCAQQASLSFGSK